MRKRGPNEEARKLRRKIFEIICLEWPCSLSEIVEKLGFENAKRNLLLVRYHVGELAKEGKIKVKKIDRALVAWPSEIERLRLIHELIK